MSGYDTGQEKEIVVVPDRTKEQMDAYVKGKQNEIIALNKCIASLSIEYDTKAKDMADKLKALTDDYNRKNSVLTEAFNEQKKDFETELVDIKTALSKAEKEYAERKKVYDINFDELNTREDTLNAKEKEIIASINAFVKDKQEFKEKHSALDKDIELARAKADAIQNASEQLKKLNDMFHADAKKKIADISAKELALYKREQLIISDGQDLADKARRLDKIQIDKDVLIVKEKEIEAKQKDLANDSASLAERETDLKLLDAALNKREANVIKRERLIKEAQQT